MRPGGHCALSSMTLAGIGFSGVQSGGMREPLTAEARTRGVVALATTTSVSVSVSVYGGVAQRCMGVASSSPTLPPPFFRSFSRYLRERSVLLSLSYWRARHAQTTLFLIIPSDSSSAKTVSIVETGSPRMTATRRNVASKRPPSFTDAALSRTQCHAAIATEREHSATSATSPSLASVTVPS